MAGLGKWLAGGIGIVTAATAAVGIGSGDLERVLRNQTAQAMLYLLLVAVGIGSGVIVWQTAGSGGDDDEPTVGGLALGGIALGASALALALFWPSLVSMSPARWLAVGLGAVLLIGAFVLLLVRTPSGHGDDGRHDLTTFLATTFIVLASGVLLLALYVNSPRAGVVVAGVLVAIVALSWVGWPLRFSVSAVLVTVGFVAFSVGLSGFFALAVENTSAKDRPTINASLSVGGDGGLSLDVGVVAAGLRSDEHVLVTIEGLHSEVSLSDVRAGRGESAYRLTSFGDSAQPLHLSRTGPDQEGSVNLAMVVPVSPGLYERLRVNAFLVSAGSDDILGQIEELDRSVAQEQADRAEFDKANGIGAIPPDIRNARLAIDDAYLKGDLDDDHYSRLLVERSAKDSELYDEQLGKDVLEARNAYDQAVQAERNRLLEVLEKEVVQDVRCAVGAQARGCVIILVPETPVLPLISAAPTRIDDEWNAEVTVEMASMSAEDVVVLAVSTRRSGDSAFEQTYAAQLPPNRIGVLATSIVLPLAPDIAQVCVTAMALNRGDLPSADTPQPDQCDLGSAVATVVEFSIPSEADAATTTSAVPNATAP